MKKTYSGGCHCGAVRYEADVDLSQGTVKCNCSICRKARTWLVAVAPSDFRLVRGEDALSEYRFGSHRIHHLFCKQCGVKSFARVAGGNNDEFVALIVTCLDDLSDEELAVLPVMYVDGRSNNFAAAPAETRYL